MKIVKDDFLSREVGFENTKCLHVDLVELSVGGLGLSDEGDDRQHIIKELLGASLLPLAISNTYQYKAQTGLRA